MKAMSTKENLGWRIAYGISLVGALVCLYFARSKIGSFCWLHLLIQQVILFFLYYFGVELGKDVNRVVQGGIEEHDPLCFLCKSGCIFFWYLAGGLLSIVAVSFSVSEGFGGCDTWILRIPSFIYLAFYFGFFLYPCLKEICKKRQQELPSLGVSAV